MAASATTGAVPTHLYGDGLNLNTRKVSLGTYATGGVAVTAATFGLTTLYAVIPLGPARKTDATDAVLYSYDSTNSKLVAYRQKDPAAAGGADIALPEVGNGVDLSSYAAECIGVGT